MVHPTFKEPLMIVKTAGSQSSRNVTYRISGRLYTDTDAAARFEIDLGEAGLKITSLLWVIQEKAGLHLWVSDHEIMLPMESRNSIRFDTPATRVGRYLYLSPFNLELSPVTLTKSLFLLIDLDR